jgi:hypothetical protein
VKHEKTELTKTRLRSFKGVLQDLETYVPSPSTSINVMGGPSAAPRQMTAKQQMCRPPNGALLILKLQMDDIIYIIA